MVLTDESKIVQNLRKRQKHVFMEPRENMRSVLPVSVISKCSEFRRDIIHNSLWKEKEFEILKTTNRILNVLGEIWCNPAFATSTSRNQQSEGTYIADIIVPLLRTNLENLPNGYVCLSTAERQSLASKARRNIGVEEERMDDDYVKLWKETLDGVSFINATCRPKADQFGIVGIQVAGNIIACSLMRLLLTLRNILITNKSLLMQALEYATSHPPRQCCCWTGPVKITGTGGVTGTN
ncbi:hypothetical protein C2G38_2219192 [Gigaspora rosea]|uniref:Uncharacterized protein n=1 Tax=Gigaspora rosea TaxID=44941 RepID=A0A397U988_9GLOM|nr:hypothetical protein C2G38_2219192 [Gigaspora rosea]